MSRYPTDEELNDWIEKLEQEELYAPKHLKEEILTNAKKQIQKARSVSFPLYTLKMAVGMAAAVVLIFTIPIDYDSSASKMEPSVKEWNLPDESSDVEMEISLDQKIRGHFDKKREETDRAVSELRSRIGNLFGRNSSGGDYNEN